MSISFSAVVSAIVQFVAGYMLSKVLDKLFFKK